jgi:hypothetical protein
MDMTQPQRINKNSRVEEILQFMQDHYIGTELVKLDELQLDPEYVRPISVYKVGVIAKDFNPIAAQTLIVSVRDDGSKWLMDGQHRRAAMLKIGITEWRTDLYSGLAKPEEATVFVFCNTVRKLPLAIERYHADIVRRVPYAVAIQAVTKKYQLTVETTARGHKPNTIGCVEAMQRIADRIGEAGLDTVMSLVLDLFPHEEHALIDTVLLGVFAFHQKYGPTRDDGNIYDRDWLVKRVRGFDFAVFRQKWTSIHEMRRQNMKNPSEPLAVRDALVMFYDSDRRTNKHRLEPREKV